MDMTGDLAIVIYGVTGDLTRRKLIPALYELMLLDRLPTPVNIIGFARREWSVENLRKTIREGVEEFGRTLPINETVLNRLLENVYYVRSSFDEIEGYYTLVEKITSLGAKNVLHYLATPPDAYIDIIRSIGVVGLNQCDNGCTRIIVEKPYGRDLASAQILENEIHAVFKEEQIYRIDHYLGKETVQNILVFRLANGIFEPLWNHKYVDHIQITVAETVGVGTRAGYYENAGVIRDIFQNHLLQLVTLIAMEAPVAFNADAVRDEKVKVLKSLRPMSEIDVTQQTYRAQYAAGMVNGKRVSGYKDEVGVAQDSLTETFLAVKLFVDNWRWAGVPFYVRSGKCLPSRTTEVFIQFKQAPLSMFSWKNMAGDAPNCLVLNLQPDESITLTFGAKIPGPANEIAPVKMNFNYKEAFGNDPPEAYERLLQDCLIGDATLFTRSDEVRGQWGITNAILESWAHHKPHHLPIYEAGTWGPQAADEFIQKDGRTWYNPE